MLVLAALAALSFAGQAAAGTAADSSKCGEKVLADWFDNGRIDRLYPLNCYEEAIDAIPDDLRDYADAEEVITRALQSALRGQLAPGGKDPTPNGNDKGDKDKGDNDKGKGNNNDEGDNKGGGNDPDGSGGGPQAAPDVDTSGPSSVPVPLMVLGGISLALLAAGGLGYLSRRRQAARAGGDDLGPLA